MNTIPFFFHDRVDTAITDELTLWRGCVPMSKIVGEHDMDQLQTDSIERMRIYE